MGGDSSSDSSSDSSDASDATGDAIGRQFEHAVWQIKFDVTDREQKHDGLGRIKEGGHWVVAPAFLSRKGREGWQVTGVTMHPEPRNAGSLLVFAQRLSKPPG